MEVGIHGNSVSGQYQFHCHIDAIGGIIINRILTRIGGGGGERAFNTATQNDLKELPTKLSATIKPVVVVNTSQHCFNFNIITFHFTTKKYYRMFSTQTICIKWLKKILFRVEKEDIFVLKFHVSFISDLSKDINNNLHGLTKYYPAS